MTAMYRFTRGGVAFTAYADGSLLVDHERLLVFSDLHLEKGRAMAGTAPLPEMDTDTTLEHMTKAIQRDNPVAVLFLGDSFHRSQMASSLPDRHRHALDASLAGRQVIWITGNHDPELPDFLTGTTRQELTLGKLVFRHEAGRLPRGGIEISGHYHPKIRLATRARRITGRCFLVTKRRMIMPAFGAYAGGLSVHDPILRRFHDAETEILFCHACRIYRYPYSQLQDIN
jgi:DNA ligase-associated metallophosphoesterase